MDSIKQQVAIAIDTKIAKSLDEIIAGPLARATIHLNPHGTCVHFGDFKGAQPPEYREMVQQLTTLTRSALDFKLAAAAPDRLAGVKILSVGVIDAELEARVQLMATRFKGRFTPASFPLRAEFALAKPWRSRVGDG
jgi:hypothetical protein